VSFRFSFDALDRLAEHPQISVVGAQVRGQRVPSHSALAALDLADERGPNADRFGRFDLGQAGSFAQRAERQAESLILVGVG
jgi:hypothetical protein